MAAAEGDAAVEVSAPVLVVNHVDLLANAVGRVISLGTGEAEGVRSVRAGTASISPFVETEAVDAAETRPPLPAARGSLR